MTWRASPSFHSRPSQSDAHFLCYHGGASAQQVTACQEDPDEEEETEEPQSSFVSVATAGVHFARANRELSSLLAVRSVVVVKGGSLSKAGIKRDQSMAFSHSYSAIQRVQIDES